MSVRWRTSTSGFQAPAQADPGGGRRAQAQGGAGNGPKGLEKSVTAVRESPVKSAAAATASAATRQAPKAALASPLKQPAKAAGRGAKKEAPAAAAAARSERLRSALQQLRASRSPQQQAAVLGSGGAAGSSTAHAAAAASADVSATASQNELAVCNMPSGLPRCSQAQPLAQHPTDSGCHGSDLDFDCSLDELFPDASLSLMARLQLGCQQQTVGSSRQQLQSERECVLPPGLPRHDDWAQGSPAGWHTAQQHSVARRALVEAAAEAELALPAHVTAAPCSSSGAHPQAATAAEVQQRLAQLRCSLRSPPLAAAAPDALTPRRLRVSAGDLVTTRPPSAASCHDPSAAAYAGSASDQPAAREGSPGRRAGTAGAAAAARLAALLAQPREQQVQQPWTWVQPAWRFADATTCSAALVPQAQPSPSAFDDTQASSLPGGRHLSFPGPPAHRSPSWHPPGRSSTGNGKELAQLPTPAAGGLSAGSGDILEAWRSRRRAGQTSHLAEKYGRYLLLQQQESQQQQQQQQRQQKDTQRQDQDKQQHQQRCTQQPQQQQNMQQWQQQQGAAACQGGVELSAPAASQPAGHMPCTYQGATGGALASAGRVSGEVERRLAVVQPNRSVVLSQQPPRQEQQQQQQQQPSFAQPHHRHAQQQQQHHRGQAYRSQQQQQQQQHTTTQAQPYQHQLQKQHTVSLRSPPPQQAQQEGPVDILERWRARRRQQGQATSGADYGALLTLRLPDGSPGRHRQDLAAPGACGCSKPLAPMAADRCGTSAADWSADPVPAVASAAAGKLAVAEGLSSPSQLSSQLAHSSQSDAGLHLQPSPLQAVVQIVTPAPEVLTCKPAIVASQPAGPGSAQCSQLQGEAPAATPLQAVLAPVPAPRAAAQEASVDDLASQLSSLQCTSAVLAQAEPEGRAESQLPSRPLSAASSSGRATPRGSQAHSLSPSRQHSFGSTCWSPGMSRLFDDVIGGLLFMDGQRPGCSTAEAVECAPAAADEAGASCHASPAEGAAGTGVPMGSGHSTDAAVAGAAASDGSLESSRECSKQGPECQQEAAAVVQVSMQALCGNQAGESSSEGPGGAARAEAAEASC